MIRLLSLTIISFLIPAILSGCGGIKKLDEKVFYEGPEFKLKLSRYYQKLFLSYDGEVFSVQCQSSETLDNKAQKSQDAGWRRISTGGAIGSKNAQDLIDQVKDDYLIMDNRTLVKKSNGFLVSFDACGTFQSWYPTALPIERIDQIPKPDHCAPKGSGDCRHYDFQGDRVPKISEIETSPEGRISFVARTPAFKDGVVFRIESGDFGRTWEFSPIGPSL